MCLGVSPPTFSGPPITLICVHTAPTHIRMAIACMVTVIRSASGSSMIVQPVSLIQGHPLQATARVLYARGTIWAQHQSVTQRDPVCHRRPPDEDDFDYEALSEEEREAAWAAFWGWDCYGPGGALERVYGGLGVPKRAWHGLKHTPELGGLTARDQDAFVGLVRMPGATAAGHNCGFCAGGLSMIPRGTCTLACQSCVTACMRRLEIPRCLVTTHQLMLCLRVK